MSKERKNTYQGIVVIFTKVCEYYYYYYAAY